MALHCVLVNENTKEFLTQVNGGVTPQIENHPTVLVYADDINDEANRIMTIEDFNKEYYFLYSDASTNNTVIKK